jgi:ankyrin repeat protein
MKPICSALLVALSVLSTFLSGCVLPDPSGIHEAADTGDIETLKEYWKRGASLNQRHYGRPPLYFTALSDQPEAAEFLIAKGANIEKRATWHDGRRPLHVAATHGHYRMVELLLEKGAKVDSRDWNGVTPLMGAVECFYEAPKGTYAKIAALLIARGANVNARDDDRGTPLHHWPRTYPVSAPTQEEYAEVVKVLIAHGADVNARDSRVKDRGETPLSSAIKVGSKGAVEAVLKAGADPNAVIERVEQLRDPEPKDHLIPYASRFATNRTTILGRAKRRGDSEIVDLLLKHGAKE